MKKVLFALIAICAMSFAFGAEGDTGTMAYQWANYKALDSVTYPYNGGAGGVSLSMFRGKVVLMNAFQYNCGGCDMNAPTIGKLADSLGSGKAGSNFQGVGTEIDNGTFAQIQTSYNTQLKKNAPNLIYPLVHVPFDTAITTDGVGTKWHRYNTYRDVYFVIDPNGKIVGHVIGNRQNAMAADSLKKLRTAIFAALAAVPTNILCLNSCSKDGLKAYRQGNGFHFNLGTTANSPAFLQILDLQGRMIRTFTIPAGSNVVWNGTGVSGNVPFGTYFAKVTIGSASASQRINWTP